MICMRTDGTTVFIKPGDATMGEQFISMTMTYEDLMDETMEFNRFIEWLSNVAFTRLAPTEGFGSDKGSF